MKTTKRLLCTLLALMLVLALAGTAFAAEKPGGTITVSGANKAETYRIYRIADLSYGAATDAFSYTIAQGWEDFPAYTATIDGVEAAVSTYLLYDEVSGVITLKAGQDADTAGKMLAKLAHAFLKSKTGTDAPGMAAEAITCGENGEVRWTGLPFGWYFVTTTTGAVCSLDTNHEDVSILEKNVANTTDKTQQEDQAGDYTDADNTAAVGDTVNYQVKLELHYGAENVVLHDKLSKGLTFHRDITIYQGEVAADKVLAQAGNYTVNTENLQDGCTFEIAFNPAYLAQITEAGEILYVQYSAELNEDAVMKNEETDSTRNQNEVQLSWGNAQKTTWDVVKTHTMQITIHKVDADADAPKPLANATFRLIRDFAGFDPTDTTAVPEEHLVTVVAERASVDSAMDVYRVCTKGDAASGHAHVTSFGTDASGKINIQGLDAGTYYLEEMEAPAGYNKLKYPVKVVVSEAGTTYYGWDEKDAEWTDGMDADGGVKIVNNTGTELPSTGGMGTTIFYVIGSVLVIGALVLLVVKKRMSR